VKKSKKAKEESSDDDLEESDTSEPENGYHGFSAAKGEDVEMSDADSSEDVEEKAAKPSGKAHEQNGGSSKKSSSDASESKLAGLNCKLCKPHNVYFKLIEP
jgi:pumilio family protein 6